jgi:hypothetical protein
MFGVIQRRFSSHEHFESAWKTEIEIPSLVRDLGEPGSLEVEQSFHGSVHYLAGYLERVEFKLFRNGGLPLIERRTGDLREELLVRLAPNGVRGAYIPVKIDLCVSNSGLREIRERYWHGSGRPPISFFSGNIGLLQEVRTFDLWNVATEDALSQLVRNIRDYTLPFLELLASPAQMRRAIFDSEIAVLDHASCLEYLIMEFGTADARQYIRQLIDDGTVQSTEFWVHHDLLKQRTQVSLKPGEDVQNLAAIALTHDLCKRWLY